VALTTRIIRAPVAFFLALLLPSLFTNSPALEPKPSIFAQGAQATLNRQFPSGSVSYLLLDAHSGEVLAGRWTNPEAPIPIGSLIKPFTALAYARTHRQFPDLVCHGQRDLCWRPAGHGRMTLETAIAQSCNAYFFSLARELSVPQTNAVLTGYGLPPVDAAHKSTALVGLSTDWQVSPLTLARAYAQLARDAHNRGSSEVFSGMRQSAKEGTARAVSLAFPASSALAKTGTAQCTHSRHATADGFTVLLFPADDPRIVLLTRVHGVTGAATAATAAQMLRALVAGP
jgi:hypothetical protein